ncbi:hypothetical protein IL306_002002 [Fusarium sp. DS 682]|nr:hypothetical protein IL306_002002 [Fusarium sp. DS 682]
MSEGPSFEPPQPEGFQLNSSAPRNSGIPLPHAVNHNYFPSGYVQVAGSTQVSAPTQAAAPARGTQLAFPRPPRPIAPQVTRPVLAPKPAQATTATQPTTDTPSKTFRSIKPKAPRTSKAVKDPKDTKAAPKPRVSKPRAPKGTKAPRATKASKAGQIAGATHASGFAFPQPAAPQPAHPHLTSGAIQAPGFALPQSSTGHPQTFGPFAIPGIPQTHPIAPQIAQALGVPGAAQTSQSSQTQQACGPVQTTVLAQPQPAAPQVTQAPQASVSVQTFQYPQAQQVSGHTRRAASRASQLYLPAGSAEAAIAGIRAAKKTVSFQLPPRPVIQQTQQSQTKAPLSKKAKGKHTEKTQKQPPAPREPQQSQIQVPLSEKAKGKQPAKPHDQQPNKSLKRSIDRVEASSSVEGPALKKTTPSEYWDRPGFSEAFKASRRDRQERRKAWAVLRSPRLNTQGALLAAELQGLQNQPMNSAGGESSNMGTQNQQASLVPLVDRPQGQHVGGPSHPRSHGKFLGGVKLSQLGLGPHPSLSPEEVENRFKLIDLEITHQQSRIPSQPPSRLPPQAPKEFVGPTYQVPPGFENTPLEKVLQRKNKAILTTQKQVDLERNNVAAKGTRNRREEALQNLRHIANMLQIETNFWRIKAVSLGADAREWDVIGDSLKMKMLEDMNTKVRLAEDAQSAEIKRRKGIEHSARNSENARLTKEDSIRKEKEVQALIAAIEAKEREIQEAVSEGREPPEMNLDELVEMTIPDVEVIAVTIGDTVDAPIPIDDNLYNCVDAKADNCININNGGVPTENIANLGENADAGGSIGPINTASVSNDMEVGNAIDINMSMDFNNAMGGNIMDAGNCAGTFTISEGSLPPNGWGSQDYGQMDNLPAMPMDLQYASWNNYVLQDSNLQNNCLPDGTIVDNGLQNDAFSGFVLQNTNLSNFMHLDNGVIHDGPFTTNGIQNTDFSNNGPQDSSFTTNGFQRIDSLDNGLQDINSIDDGILGNASINNGLQDNSSNNGIQGSDSINYLHDINSVDDGILGNASINNGLQDNSSINNGIQGNDPIKDGLQSNGNPAKKRKTSKPGKANKTDKVDNSSGRATQKPENTRIETTKADNSRIPPRNYFPNGGNLNHIDYSDPYALGRGPSSFSQQIITPRASDFKNDEYLTFENSFTSAGNRNLFTYEEPPSDAHNNGPFANDFSQIRKE